MSSKRAYEVWQSENGSDDILQLKQPNGNVLGGINASGAGYGSLAGGSSLKAQRTLYTVTSTDVGLGQTQAIIITWAVPFADANYTLVSSVTLVSFLGSSAVAVASSYRLTANFTKQAQNYSVSLVVGGNATAGDVVAIESIAVHD
jgi:hypothetical protein